MYKQIDKQITLKFAENCYVIFNFTEFIKDRRKHKDSSLQTYIEIHLPVELHSEPIKSIKKAIRIQDWYELCVYFEDHIDKEIRRDPEPSIVFLTYELLFRVQAMAGIVNSREDGAFNLRFDVNIGWISETEPRIFCGFDTNIDVKDLLRFVQELRDFLVELERDFNVTST